MPKSTVVSRRCAGPSLAREHARPMPKGREGRRRQAPGPFRQRAALLQSGPPRRIEEAKAAREDEMVTGPTVLVIAFGVLAVLWVVVIYGSHFFGPKTG